MGNELQYFEPAAKVLAATAMSQTVSFCMERKYLSRIAHGDCFKLKAHPQSSTLDASWIKINQVGKPLEDSAANCFTAIQKILYSCFIPDEVQLLFLITSNGKENSMYLGLRKSSNSGIDGINSKSQIKYLNEFINGAWPGLQTEVVKESDDTINALKKDIAGDNLEYIYALTGIPSMESQYKTVYPATMNMLMAGMNKSKRYAYLVVADPVPSNDVEQMLFQCRDMDGQVESLKSINVQQSFSQGISQSRTLSKSVTDSITKTMSESVSKKDFSVIGKAALGATGVGLGLAASVFPAAAGVLNGVVNASGAIASAALGVLGLSAIADVMIPTKTTGTSTSEGRSITNSASHTEGTSENHTQSVSRNLLNKHAEAVAEHLFYHSKRFETGKAIGMWKVGVYLMANKSADINGGALQLRSILSGQESIFEPVRIHDISSVLSDEIRDHSLGQLTAPWLEVNDVNDRSFKHPLGKHYAELKTVLTTKELSYLVNFPLHSVPGISVIECSPEFSLNAPNVKGEEAHIDFGKLLYGGSLTEMAYILPVSQLAKHTLLSGINGTGKTNTVQSILNSLSDKLPFLIIEPAKTEYVDWAIEYNKTHADKPVTIYMPGCKQYRDRQTKGFVKIDALKLNPFEIVWLSKDQEPNVLSHIDRLKSTFAAAFPMYDILPVLMEDLIYALYQKKSTDWLTNEPIFGKTLPPTLTSMKLSVAEVIKELGYAPQIESNMMACLNTRINSLMRGWKGEMLNTLKSTSWEDIFERPVVINLSYVGDDVDKGFFMALILQFLYEYLTAKADIGKVDFNSNTCKHLTIIEEAHRVMMKCDKEDMPQYKTAMMFSNMLSEVRAYGEGMLLVDQVPTRLIPDAIKNTNTKITHRLVSEDDVKAISESMGITKEQRMIIPKLLVGQCIISTALTTDKHWVRVNKVK